MRAVWQQLFAESPDVLVTTGRQPNPAQAREFFVSINDFIVIVGESR